MDFTFEPMVNRLLRFDRRQSFARHTAIFKQNHNCYIMPLIIIITPTYVEQLGKQCEHSMPIVSLWFSGCKLEKMSTTKHTPNIYYYIQIREPNM